MRDREKTKGTKSVSQTIDVRDDGCVLTVDEIRNLAKDSGKPAETLMNLVALIAGLITVVIVASVTATGSSVKNLFNSVVTSF